MVVTTTLKAAKVARAEMGAQASSAAWLAERDSRLICRARTKLKRAPTNHDIATETRPDP